MQHEHYKSQQVKTRQRLWQALVVASQRNPLKTSRKSCSRCGASGVIKVK